MELQPSSAQSGPTSEDEASSSTADASIKGAQGSAFVTVECGDRWQVYFRLQELEIACQCKSYQPLLVDIQSVQSLVQLWSVVKRVSAPRSDLAQWLNQCLSLPSPRLDF